MSEIKGQGVSEDSREKFFLVSSSFWWPQIFFCLFFVPYLYMVFYVFLSLPGFLLRILGLLKSSMISF